jgi:hypothetical protein
MENTGTAQSPSYVAVFPRRKNHQAAGLTYTVQFSADLATWTDETATPTVLTAAGSPGEMEVVGISFPATVPLQGGGNAAPKFFRVRVTSG